MYSMTSKFLLKFFVQVFFSSTFYLIFFVLAFICRSLHFDSFWEGLAMWLKVLKPFQDLTEKLGGDTYTTMTSVPYRVAVTAKILESMKNNTLSELYAKALRHRFEPWFKPGIAMAAAVLDPSYAHAQAYLAEYFKDAEQAKCVVDETWERLHNDFGYFCSEGIGRMCMPMEDYINWGEFGKSGKIGVIWCHLIYSINLCVFFCFRKTVIDDSSHGLGKHTT